MRYSWIPTIVLHLLPILSVLLTWNKPWPAALERIIRVQVIASVLYVPACSLCMGLDWPGFSLSQFGLADLFAPLEGEGLLLYGGFLVTASAVTALAAFLRRKWKNM